MFHSIEAARVGAAGKGSAVVEEEIRNLAGKSAEASELQYTVVLEKSISFFSTIILKYVQKLTNDKWAEGL